MKKLVPVLVGVVIGVLAVVLAVNLKVIKLGARSALPSPTCETHVKLSVQNDAQNKPQIVVDPAQTVCLALTRPLIWDIVGKGRATIVFEDHPDENQQLVTGPFPDKSASNQYNLKRGVYSRNSEGPLNSNGAELTGRWKYTVKWHFEDAPDPPDADPYVCIRD